MKSNLSARSTKCSICGGTFGFLVVETEEEDMVINPDAKKEFIIDEEILLEFFV